MESLIILFSNQIKQDRQMELAFNDISALLDEFYGVETPEQ